MQQTAHYQTKEQMQRTREEEVTKIQCESHKLIEEAKTSHSMFAKAEEEKHRKKQEECNEKFQLERASFWEDFQKKKLELERELEGRRDLEQERVLEDVQGRVDCALQEMHRTMEEKIKTRVRDLDECGDGAVVGKTDRTGALASSNMEKELEDQMKTAQDSVRGAMQALVEDMVENAKSKVEKIWKDSGKEQRSNMDNSHSEKEKIDDDRKDNDTGTEEQRSNMINFHNAKAKDSKSREDLLEELS